MAPHAVIDSTTERHTVLFYEDGRELTRSACRYLAPAALEGGAIVLIATPEHTAAVTQALRGAGVDLDRARAAGRLRCLDAEATLRALRPDGQLDASRFRELIGGELAAAGAGGRPIAAYGEMVALLWDAGEVLAALELEALWNELGRELRFSLLCGYRRASVGAPGDAEALEHVCRLHNEIIGAVPGGGPAARALELKGSYPAELQAPGLVRQRAVAALQEHGFDGELVEAAAVVATELASNAVLHAATPFSLDLRAEGGILRIAVEDARTLGDQAAADALVPRPTRGLGLIHAIASRWGVERVPTGKIVWAEIPCERPDLGRQAGPGGARVAAEMHDAERE